MKNMIRLFKRISLTHQAWIALFICMLIACIVRMTGDNAYICNFGCDVQAYTDLSKTFVRGGQFSFLHYPANIRGYFFPFMLRVIFLAWLLVGINYELAIAFCAILFSSFLFAVILPGLFLKKSTYWTLLLRILPYGIFLFFWSDMVFYPLSDLWAFGFGLLAAYLLCRLGAALPDVKVWRVCLLSVAAGALLYMAYNTRTIYLYAGLPLVLAFVIMNRKAGLRILLPSLLCCVMGFFIVAAPQMAINAQQTGKATYKVVTDIAWSEGRSLNLVQLDGGIEMQRYDTYVFDYASGPVPFYDNAGMAMLEQEGLRPPGELAMYQEPHFDDLAQYIALVCRHPLTFLGIYARHAINMLHMPYRQVYVTDLQPDAISTIVNYILLFFCAVGLWASCVARGVKKALFGSPAKIYLLTLLIPCAMLLAGAVEQRFFMPAYVACYIYVAYSVCNRDMLRYVRRRWLPLLLAFVCVFACLCAVWGNTFMSLPTRPLL